MRFVHLMQDGGWGMWFVLTFGLITLAAAVGFALRPRPGGEAAVRSFSRATTFSILSTVCLDLAVGGSHIANGPAFANHPKIHLVVLEGIAESLAPAILGCTLLSLAWLVMAVGQRRLARELAP
ncbi:MAG: hypothetical protein RL033_3654 [Pseudomonadota bacterium]|jgi:hypothetical protein